MTVSESFEFHSRALFDTLQLATEAMPGVHGHQSGKTLFFQFLDGHLSNLTRHPPVEQIWFADGPLRWHFTYDSVTGFWVDTQGRGDLLEIVCAMFERRLGHQVAISA